MKITREFLRNNAPIGVDTYKGLVYIDNGYEYVCICKHPNKGYFVSHYRYGKLIDSYFI